MNKKVIQLGHVRDMLSHLDVLRERILSGDAKGIHTTFLDSGGESVFASGVFKDPQMAISAILNASAHRMLVEDDPPLFQASTF